MGEVNRQYLFDSDLHTCKYCPAYNIVVEDWWNVNPLLVQIDFKYRQNSFTIEHSGRQFMKCQDETCLNMLYIQKVWFILEHNVRDSMKCQDGTWYPWYYLHRVIAQHRTEW